MNGQRFALFATAMFVIGAMGEDMKPDVLFVLVDSLKSSHLGCYGYRRNTTPNIDRMARDEFVRFDTCIAGGSWTQPAVMTLFTSLPADKHRRVLPRLPHSEDVTTLAQVFKDAGYATVGITANTMTNHRYGYGKGFDVWDDYSATLPPGVGLDKISVGYARGAVMTKLGLNRLARRDPKKPLFLFLFYMDPHWEFRPPPPYDRMFADESVPQLKQTWTITKESVTPEQRERVIAAYDGEIAYCDHAISNLVATVAESPRGRDTVIVITGDHGESFWERKYSAHGNNLYEEEIRVPLLIRPPLGSTVYSPGAVVKGQIGAIDIAPTLLDLAGIPIPSSWEGRSLKGMLHGGDAPERPVVTETRIRSNIWQRAVRTDRYKVISLAPFESVAEVYDLVADPGETNNLAVSPGGIPEDAKRLLRYLPPSR